MLNSGKGDGKTERKEERKREETVVSAGAFSPSGSDWQSGKEGGLQP